MSQTISTRVAELGLSLGAPASPAANYVSYARADHLVHVSGQIGRRDGKVAYPGRLGAEVAEAAGIEAARLSALGILSQIAAATGDRIDRVARIVKMACSGS